MAPDKWFLAFVGRPLRADPLEFSLFDLESGALGELILWPPLPAESRLQLVPWGSKLCGIDQSRAGEVVKVGESLLPV